jgi:hypothetical protein
MSHGQVGPDSTVTLRLLDSFGLSVAGEEVDLPGGARRLLAFLALVDGSVLRSHVAYTLWPDTSEERSRSNLRAALWRLRGAAGGLVDQSAGRLRLGAGVDVDTRDVLGLARVILAGADPGPVRDVCRRLGAGDLLTDWYDSWLTEPREHLRQVRLHALEAMGARELDEAGSTPPSSRRSPLSRPSRCGRAPTGCSSAPISRRLTRRRRCASTSTSAHCSSASLGSSRPPGSRTC